MDASGKIGHDQGGHTRQCPAARRRLPVPPDKLSSSPREFCSTLFRHSRATVLCVFAMACMEHTIQPPKNLSRGARLAQMIKADIDASDGGNRTTTSSLMSEFAKIIGVEVRLELGSMWSALLVCCMKTVPEQKWFGSVAKCSWTTGDADEGAKCWDFQSEQNLNSGAIKNWPRLTVSLTRIFRHWLLVQSASKFQNTGVSWRSCQ